MIGSEGTLAAVTRVTVDLIARPAGLFSGLAFFPSLVSALRFVVAARRDAGLQPRALELFDRAALEIARDNPEGIVWPDATGAAIAFKQEYRDGAERDARLDTWLGAIEAALTLDAAPAMADAVLVMDDPAARGRLRAFRHRVPATLNEKVGKYRQQGGGKLGTDWWVPYPEIPEFLEGWRRRLAEERIQTVMFGHIGNGHPHVNFLPRDADEKERAQALLVEMCRGAVALGGGVAGEHGLGKLKRELLAVQYPEARIAAMREIKRRWDPHWILGRGNLFPPEDV